MKKILYLAILSVLATNVFAQCKYETDKIDKFSGKPEKHTKYTKVFTDSKKGFLGCATRLNGESKYLVFRFASYSSFSVKEGGKLLFLLTDGTQIELLSSEYEIASPIAGGRPTVWAAYIDYPLDGETLDKLSKAIITDIKFYTTVGYIEMELKAKFQSAIAVLMPCIK